MPMGIRHFLISGALGGLLAAGPAGASPDRPGAANPGQADPRAAHGDARKPSDAGAPCPGIGAAIEKNDPDALAAELKTKSRDLNTACCPRGDGQKGLFPLELLLTLIDDARALKTFQADPSNAPSHGAERTLEQWNQNLTRMFKMLVAGGADVNLHEEHGYTLLMMAALSESVLGVRTLLEAGADPNARSGEGETALSIVQDEFSDTDEGTRIIELLKKAGAKG